VEACAKPALGVGLYEPLPGGKLKSNVVYLYVEAEAFSMNAHGDGSFEASLEVMGRFSLDGAELGERSLGRHHFFTRDPMPLTAFSVDLKLGEKVPPGEYAVELKVKCAISGAESRGQTRFSAP
jgi:hypothetical protein